MPILLGKILYLPALASNNPNRCYPSPRPYWQHLSSCSSHLQRRRHSCRQSDSSSSLCLQLHLQMRRSASAPPLRQQSSPHQTLQPLPPSDLLQKELGLVSKCSRKLGAALDFRSISFFFPQLSTSGPPLWQAYAPCMSNCNC